MASKVKRRGQKWHSDSSLCGFLDFHHALGERSIAKPTQRGVAVLLKPPVAQWRKRGTRDSTLSIQKWNYAASRNLEAKPAADRRHVVRGAGAARAKCSVTERKERGSSGRQRRKRRKNFYQGRLLRMSRPGGARRGSGVWPAHRAVAAFHSPLH